MNGSYISNCCIANGRMTVTQRILERLLKTKRLRCVAHFPIFIFPSWGLDKCFEVFQTVPSTQTLRTGGTYHTKAHETGARTDVCFMYSTYSLQPDVNLYGFYDAVCLALYMASNFVITVD